ncbi:hypothetical protein COEREDRAFT_7574 [Coemansia reversa NRRL 1564]|uniref:Uncharacterized protein n=1 Tax=Coemansia reversa (strain ATCC 12441 / NRRL 1564) TaxID=763665 RepID=A0A2G5BDY0_COERN|nr:hypothetical protein COEREDRAFT_7574 [Coemansia reversa NRRL 1564]|eukprot:PIA17213.1 hypothetical protein COEREDRAFT_7574 [Coemansia reversa NRRL 1564]
MRSLNQQQHQMRLLMPGMEGGMAADGTADGMVEGAVVEDGVAVMFRKVGVEDGMAAAAAGMEVVVAGMVEVVVGMAAAVVGTAEVVAGMVAEDTGTSHARLITQALRFILMWSN